MTIDEIKCAILQMIEDIYKKRYIGKLAIKRLEPQGLMVILGMNNMEKPITISAQLDDVSFLKFFRKELHDRGLNTVLYFEGVKSYPDNCNNTRTRSCKCNEAIK